MHKLNAQINTAISKTLALKVDQAQSVTQHIGIAIRRLQTPQYSLNLPEPTTWIFRLRSPRSRAGYNRFNQHDAEEEENNPEEDRTSAFDRDRKSTRLNSSHLGISYAVFCF